MSTFLIILMVLAMLATVAALVRGIVIFLKTSEADLKGGNPSSSGLRQNKMMQARIGFQALAIIFVILFLMMARGG